MHEVRGRGEGQDWEGGGRRGVACSGGGRSGLPRTSRCVSVAEMRSRRERSGPHDERPVEARESQQGDEAEESQAARAGSGGEGRGLCERFRTERRGGRRRGGSVGGWQGCQREVRALREKDRRRSCREGGGEAQRMQEGHVEQ